jgi:hypothetical protein
MNWTAKSLVFIALLAFGGSAYSQRAVQLSGENSVVLNGHGFVNKKIAFTSASADWYVTENDGHGTILLKGPFDSRNVMLNLEWDGKKEQYVINDETRHDSRRMGDFTLTMPDKDVYGDGLNAYPSGDQEVIIKIDRVTTDRVIGTISGVISQNNDKISVTGQFGLMRKPVIQKSSTSATFKEYDNVIHDKLIGAQFRSPTESEVKYDLSVKSMFLDAFKPVTEFLAGKSWTISTSTDLTPSTGMPRSYLNDQWPAFELKMQMDHSAAAYQEYVKRSEELSAEMTKHADDDQFKPLMEKAKQLGYMTKGATIINITGQINSDGNRLSNYKGDIKVLTVPGIDYVIQIPHARALGGGGEENSLDVTQLFLGIWKSSIKKDADGSQDIVVTPNNKKNVDHLSVKNVVIRIECSRELAEEVIRTMDLQKLKAILGQ